jgi:hypothetical protein
MIGSLRGKGCLLKIAFAFSGIKFHSIFPGAYQLNRFGLFPRQRLQNARRWPDSDMTPRAKRRRRRSFKQANVPKAKGGFAPAACFCC